MNDGQERKSLLKQEDISINTHSEWGTERRGYLYQRIECGTSSEETSKGNTTERKFLPKVTKIWFHDVIDWYLINKWILPNHQYVPIRWLLTDQSYAMITDWSPITTFGIDHGLDAKEPSRYDSKCKRTLSWQRWNRHLAWHWCSLTTW